MPETRTLTLDDIFALEQVTDAQISPDGSQVAFVVTRDYSEPGYETPAAGIWSVPFDGSAPPRQLTSGPHADRHPRWSPDGKTLAFLSDRENPGKGRENLGTGGKKAEICQIYTLELAGGRRPPSDGRAGRGYRLQMVPRGETAGLFWAGCGG